jgi:hypothetical protein
VGISPLERLTALAVIEQIPGRTLARVAHAADAHG